MNKNIIYASVCGLSLLFGSCAKFDLSDPSVSEPNSCKLIFNASKTLFDDEQPTRGSDDWNDGDIVYLSFSAGSEHIAGKAVYNLSADEWTLYYDGIISTGSASSCKAYFFEGDYKTSDKSISLSSATATYTDLAASYSKTSEGMTVNATLSPATSRIRFKAVAETEFNISGVTSFDNFSLSDYSLNESGSAIPLKVDESGLSPYAYVFFNSASRNLTITYSNLSFTTECEHPILDEGLSGYMELPTEEKHNGWEMTKIFLPELDKPSVSDIGLSKATFSSAILSSGNGTLSDCGFCYSTSANPTITDGLISCGVQDAKFGKSVSDLQENTTYHLRAYATNELGTAYSEDVTFTTEALTAPTLSAVTVENIDSYTATLRASVTSVGNGTLQEVGFVYSTNQYPGLDDSKVSCGKNTTLTAGLSGLKPETKYYVRAFAINEKGTSFSQETYFTTPKVVIIPYTTITVETSFGSVQFDMARVDGGTFMMGAQSASASQQNYDKDAFKDESPVHKVTLSSFYVGKTEVTQKLWYVVMGSYPNVSSTYGMGDDYPVYNVTYAQCEQFIQKLNTLTGKKFRMPTEAEWEYAAKGGKSADAFKYSGSNVINDVAWQNGNSNGKTHPAAQKQPNKVRAYDMSGNVWEWCSDWYGNYTMADQTNPGGATTGPGRVIRGGAFNDAASECRVSVRSNANPASALPSLGLRLVMQ